MYGLVNRAIEDLVRTRFGDARWEAVRQRARVTVPAFVGMQAYPDKVTYDLVGAASEELGVPADTLLEAFGEYWTLYTAREGYGPMLALGGTSFVEFLQNLDHMHAHVALSMPDLEPPSFWCTDVTDRSVLLHYKSHRAGLAPMVKGLVRGLGQMFDTEVRLEHLRGPADGADHDQFRIEYQPRV